MFVCLFMDTFDLLHVRYCTFLSVNYIALVWRICTRPLNSKHTSGKSFQMAEQEQGTCLEMVDLQAGQILDIL